MLHVPTTAATTATVRLCGPSAIHHPHMRESEIALGMRVTSIAGTAVLRHLAAGPFRERFETFETCHHETTTPDPSVPFHAMRRHRASALFETPDPILPLLTLVAGLVVEEAEATGMRATAAAI